MKPKGKILSLLLAICLVAGLLPTVSFAADGNKTIMWGTSGIQNPAEITDTKGKYYTPNSYIYFGVYESAPIKWRVLDADKANDNSTDGMFLLSEYLLARAVSFDKDGGPNEGQTNPNEYQHSDAQAWCKTFATNPSNFSTPEQSAMQGVAKTDSAKNLYNVEWGESSLTTDDKMFFLSAQELADYVGNYDLAPGLKAEFVTGFSGMWWLRSPYAIITNYAGIVGAYGIVDKLLVNYPGSFTTRPAFNLDLNSVLFTSVAEGGKISTGADAIFEIGDYTGNEWKLTVLDSSRNFSISNATINGSSGTIGFSYSDAQTGTNEYISVVIVDNGAITHYGRILQLDGTTNGASGTASLTLPAGVTLSDTTKLYVFNEQYNGGESDDTRLTDYGSKLIDVQSAVDTTAPTLSNGSATRDSETNATVKFTSDEAGTYYYAVVESNEAAPTIDTTGTGTVCDTTEQTISLNNLSGAGAKDIYIVAKDAAGNVSQPLKISIPAIYTLTVNLNGGSGSTTGGEYPAGEVINIDAGSRSNYRFNGWTSSNGGAFADASSASTAFTMPAADTTITAAWSYNGGSTGGGSGDPTYSISLPSKVTGGSVTATKRYAEKGEAVTLTAIPDEGYELDTLTVTDSKGNKIDLTHKGGNEYTFKMPAGRVEIEVSFREIAVELPFTDVLEDAWYADAAAYVYKHGLMAGTSATTFAPDATTSRSMIATILWRMAGSPVVNYALDYTDVAQGQWYSEAIRWAASEGIVGGYGNGLFGTNDPITREQFAVMLYRYAQEQGYDVSVGENTNILSYADVADLSEYAISAMQWAVGAGIINGTGDGSTLTPQGQATRAQAAVMLMRFCELDK